MDCLPTVTSWQSLDWEGPPHHSRPTLLFLKWKEKPTSSSEPLFFLAGYMHLYTDVTDKQFTQISNNKALIDLHFQDQKFCTVNSKIWNSYEKISPRYCALSSSPFFPLSCTLLLVKFKSKNSWNEFWNCRTSHLQQFPLFATAVPSHARW